MKYNINVDDWRDDAVLKKAQGYSNRKIAVMLFDNKNYRNRLNTFFKQESVIEDVFHKQCELELKGEVNSSYKTPKIGHSQPVICYLDIECSPTKSYTWRRFKENICIIHYCYTVKVQKNYQDNNKQLVKDHLLVV